MKLGPGALAVRGAEQRRGARGDARLPPEQVGGWPRPSLKRGTGVEPVRGASSGDQCLGVDHIKCGCHLDVKVEVRRRQLGTGG